MRLRELVWRAVNAVRTEIHRAAERVEAQPVAELPVATDRAPAEGPGESPKRDVASATTSTSCMACDNPPAEGLTLCRACLAAYKPAREAAKARRPRARAKASLPSAGGGK